jgi:hypothetical protein
MASEGTHISISVNSAGEQGLHALICKYEAESTDGAEGAEGAAAECPTSAFIVCVQLMLTSL